ncbi:hypothetical protein G4B88_028828 [Cannabis sativa]|uniref:Aldehyde dehydrogenase domain-containing protein n=1 Tax=Cannabis sativa TaxID=3483 RepID=A0A7J6DY30_CANSA|nr:hypothetical protein G4B88_028828 [Cannabis sativa]
MKHFIRVKASWLRSGHVDSQRAKRVSENVPLVVIFQIPSPDSQCTAIAQRRPPSTVESSELGQLLWCNKNEHNPVIICYFFKLSFVSNIKFLDHATIDIIYNNNDISDMHMCISAMECQKNLQGDLESMRVFYRSGATKEISWRKSQLKGLLTFLEENEADIMNALKQDLGKHYNEAFRDEVGTLIKSLNLALKSLKTWMSPKKARLPAIALLTTAELVPEPLGLVLIFSSWNFPFGLSLEPLIGALAAGNTAVLKPSELSPTCSFILANTMPSYLDGKAVKVIQGGSDVGEQLLQHRWDKIFFTGSPRVAQIVMSAAAKFLTPIVLELGGKCPAVFDSLSYSWDREAAVRRILVGKFGTCAGQACITIDHVLVEKNFLPILVDLLKTNTRKMFGENPQLSNSMARIVNKHNFLRLKNLLDDPAVKSSILEKIEDSIEFIKLRPKPLAIYAFTKSKTLERRIISETSSGSVTMNDAIIQYAADAVPFGGVGESGIGRYHGKFSFDTFSHEKTVVRRSFFTDFWFRYPPWNDHQLQLFRVAYNYDYLGIALVMLGLKRAKKNSYSI